MKNFIRKRSKEIINYEIVSLITALFGTTVAFFCCGIHSVPIDKSNPLLCQLELTTIYHMSHPIHWWFYVSIFFLIIVGLNIVLLIAINLKIKYPDYEFDPTGNLTKMERF